MDLNRVGFGTVPVSSSHSLEEVITSSVDTKEDSVKSTRRDTDDDSDDGGEFTKIFYDDDTVDTDDKDCTFDFFDE